MGNLRLKSLIQFRKKENPEDKFYSKFCTLKGLAVSIREVENNYYIYTSENEAYFLKRLKNKK